MASEITCERNLSTGCDFRSTSTTPRSSSAPNSLRATRPKTNNRFGAVFHNVEHENSNVGDIDKNVRSLNANAILAREASPLSTEYIRNNEQLLEDVFIDNRFLNTSTVWVNEKTYGWWPGEIINKNRTEKTLYIQLFGNTSPRTVEICDTSNEYVIPFDHNLSTELRKEREHSNAFNKALSEAMNKGIEDDDLPSEDLAIRNVVESPSKRRKVGRKRLTRVTDSDDQNFSKDESLTIPGELVLACERKKYHYYPAQIISYTEPDKYKVRFCDGSTRSVSRKEFYTKYEEEFLTCQLGEIFMEVEDPNYHDPELIEKVHNLEGELYRVLNGMEESAWRYQHFIEGGKKRRLLAHKVSSGPFDKSQFSMVARVLRGMFIPEISESIDRHTVISPPENKGLDTLKKSQSNDEAQSVFHRYSKELQLRFVNDVLLPETIIRLIMDEEKIDYETAEDKMLTGYGEKEWVEELLAQRTSFQVGRESLREKA